jgi:hypothetical protein
VGKIGHVLGGAAAVRLPPVILLAEFLLSAFTIAV